MEDQLTYTSFYELPEELEVKVLELVRLINENEARDYWINIQGPLNHLRDTGDFVFWWYIRPNDLFNRSICMLQEELRLRFMYHMPLSFRQKEFMDSKGGLKTRYNITKYFFNNNNIQFIPFPFQFQFQTPTTKYQNAERT